MVSCISFGQKDFDNNTAFTLVTSPGSWDDGASIGLQFEGMNTIVYYGAELYLFPNLHNMDYTHLIGRVGLNHYIGRDPYFSKVRLFAGGRGGAIQRDGTYYGLLGLEAGIDVIPFTNFFGRISATSDMKADSKIWSNDSYHTVNSVIVGVGYRF